MGRVRGSIIWLLGFATLLGCDTSPEHGITAPVAASFLISLTSEEEAILDEAGITVLQPADGQQAVTGGIGTTFDDPFGLGSDIKAKLAFSAVRHVDGTFSGQFDRRIMIDGTLIEHRHGDVLCFRIEGNRALIIGVSKEQEEMEFPAFDKIDVTDNGEGGSDPPDQWSFLDAVDVIPEDNPEQLCEIFEVQGGQTEATQGNLQVHE